MKKLLMFFLTAWWVVGMYGQPTTSNEFVGSDPQIEIYIVSQGYTTGSIGDFEDFVDNFLDLLWNTEPYETYKQKFKIVKVYDYASTDTFPRAFMQFSAEDPDYLCSPGAASGSETYEDFLERMDELSQDLNMGDNDYLLAVFNNDFYTGGGGKYTFVTDFCDAEYMYHVAVHEFSHTFALLGDEYGPQEYQTVDSDDFPLFIDRNITEATTLSDVPWKYLIPGGTPIPTCNGVCVNMIGCSYTVVGTYEGANYECDDWYRPKPTCKMNNVEQEFCEVCHEIIKETIIKHLCPSGPTISESFDSRHTGIAHWRKSTTSMSSTSAVGDKVNLNFLADEAVVLTSGFHAKSGSNFHAYTGDCSYIDIRNDYRPDGGHDRVLVEGIKKLNPQRKDLVIYPNPANHILKLTASRSISEVSVIGMDGRIVFTRKFSQVIDVDIDISKFVSGIYTVEVVTDDAKVLYDKFVKQ